MLSYHNDENLKRMVIAEMIKHQEQNQIVKSIYKDKEDVRFKGYAAACTIDSINLILNKSYDTSNHAVFEEAIGVPEFLANLQDFLFENLPIGEDTQFAINFLKAIPVGVNLEPVKWKFCIFILKENIERVLSLSDLTDELKNKIINSIKVVLNLQENAINTGSYEATEAAAVAEAAARMAEAEAASARSEAASALGAEVRATTKDARKTEAARAKTWAITAEVARVAWAAAAAATWIAKEETTAKAVSLAVAWTEWGVQTAASYQNYQKYAKELIRLLENEK